MNTRLLTRARSHFCHEMAPRHVQRHNIAAWVRSIRMLGDKWVYAKNVELRRVGSR